MKKCSRCGEEKELYEFDNDKYKKDGKVGVCKSCRVEERKKNKVRDTEYSMWYRSVFKDKINERGRKWYESNKEYKAMKSSIWYSNNKEQKLMNEKLRRDSDLDGEKKRHIRYQSEYAKYKTFAHELTIDESPILANDGISMEVKCKYCGQYFIPTNAAVIRRTGSLKGRNGGENNLYCSENCKESCPTYNKRDWPELANKHDHSREVQAELRQMVFELDGWECQRCGATTQDAELHCHHLTGVEINPIESADVDNCITLCKFHHNELHSREGCTYADFRRKACKVKED